MKNILFITMLLGALYSQCQESNWEDFYPDMTNCYLPNANLYNAQLSGANLSNANLTGANLNCLNHSICLNQ